LICEYYDYPFSQDFTCYVIKFNGNASNVFSSILALECCYSLNEATVAHNADSIAGYHNTRGINLVLLGRKEEACEDFDRSIALGNKNAERYKAMLELP
jgi:predicted RNA polymerase sigma factor